MVKKPGHGPNDGKRLEAKGRGMASASNKRPAAKQVPPKPAAQPATKGVPAAARQPATAVPMVADAGKAGGAATVAPAAAAVLDTPLALASEALEVSRTAPPLTPIRYLKPPDPAWAVAKVANVATANTVIVPLSHSVHEGIWAFRFTDLLAELTNPAVASRVPGTVRISARLKPTDGKPTGELIELAHRAGPSGLRVLLTRTRWKTKANDGSTAFEPDPEGIYVAETRLVASDGSKAEKTSIEAIVFKHDLYETETRATAGLSPVSTVDLVTSLHNPKGKAAALFGHAPAGLGSGVATLSRGVKVLATSPIDRYGRFLLRNDVTELFSASEIDVKLSFEPPAAGAAIGLSYRLSRQDEKNPADAVPGAHHTARTKLIQPLPAGMEAAKIPPLHLVLT